MWSLMIFKFNFSDINPYFYQILSDKEKMKSNFRFSILNQFKLKNKL